MYLLDTNVLSETMKPRPAEALAAWMRAQPAASLFTAAMCQAEILAGIAVWAYALQLLEYGMDPTAMKSAVHKSWEDVWPAMEKVDEGQNEIMFATMRATSYPDSWVSFEVMILSSDTSAYSVVLNGHNFFRRVMLNLSLISRELWSALEEAEAGVLRDFSDEIKRIKAGEDVSLHAEPDFPVLTRQADACKAFGARPKPRTPRRQPSSVE